MRDASSLIRIGWSVDRIARHFASYREDYGIDLGSSEALSAIKNLIISSDLAGNRFGDRFDSVLVDSPNQTENLHDESPSWSPQQDGAIMAVKKWLHDKSSEQVFRLFGYAGTGKTTLAKHFAQDVHGRVLYAAFTGKASLGNFQKLAIHCST